MQVVLLIHNISRWAILIFGLWTIFSAIGGIVSKRNYTNTDNKANLFFMIFMDIQLLLGLVLYFNNGWFDMLKNNAKVVMKDGVMRFFAMEHFIMMIIAWLLVHVGRSVVKKAATDKAKFNKTFLFFGLALLIVLAMIPWPFRQAGISRSWFPSI